MIDNNEYEMIYLAQEANEKAQEYLLEKYNYIIKTTISKNININNFNSSYYQELYSEGLIALLHAILNYDLNQNAKLSTFAYLLVDRSIKKYIHKLNNKNNQLINYSYSLDSLMMNKDISFMEVIKDLRNDPYTKIINIEKINISSERIKQVLSKFEYEVYSFMLKDYNYTQIANVLNKTPKQIDNTIQRIKAKLKTIKLLEF